jgi:formylglycine-generating enzyme required for sulfatase activity
MAGLPRLVKGLLAASLLVGSIGATSDAPAAGPVFVNSLGMRLVLVPAGTFRMGSPAGEPHRQDEEIVREVTLTIPFRIGATEVTQRQWLALMPAHRSAEKGDELPVTSVSFTEAQDFCQRLTAREGVTYRLPTEAEWEYACRATSAEAPVSASQLSLLAWFADNSDGGPHPVGLKEPNAWGLHDMLGNVAEWTQDAYAPYPAATPVADPKGPASGHTRVVRGGSFRGLVPALRCGARASASAAYQLPHLGLRLVQEIRDSNPSPAAPTRPARVQPLAPLEAPPRRDGSAAAPSPTRS